MGRNPPRKLTAKRPPSAAAPASAPAHAPAHAPAKEAPDWQLAPLYSLLDNWENKRALDVVAKLQKKYPTSNLLTAIKAIALSRLGDHAAAYVAARAVLDCEPPVADPVVLQTLQFALRPMAKFQDMASMYERASRAMPQDEELAAHAVMAYARCRDWLQAAQLAQLTDKRFAARGKLRYAYWRAACTHVAAMSAAEPADKARLLQDARDQLAQLDARGQMTHYEHVSLLLQVLADAAAHAANSEDAAAADAHADAARIVRKYVHPEHGVFKLKEDAWRAQLEHLPLAGEANARQVVRVATDAVREHPDDWYAWSRLVVASVALSSDSDAAAAVMALAREIQEVHGDRARAAYLAPLELARALAADAGAATTGAATTGADADALDACWRVFGTKPCFFADVARYLVSDSGKRSPVPAYVAWARATVGSGSHVPFEMQLTPRGVARAVNAYKLRRFFALEVGEGERAADAVGRLLQAYAQARELDTDMLPTDVRHADDLLHLAALHALDAANESDTLAVWRTVDLVEQGVQRSPKNAQFRLLLVILYMELGAPTLAAEHFEALVIKNIQFDTLAHLLLDPLARLAACFPTLLATYAGRSQSIHQANTRETPEMLAEALSRGALSKVAEFARFYDRLDSSAARMAARAAAWRADTIRMHRPVPKKGMAGVAERVRDAVSQAGVVDAAPRWDNRDMNVVQAYVPPSKERRVPRTEQRVLRDDLRVVAAVQAAIRGVVAHDADAARAALEQLQALEDERVDMKELAHVVRVVRSLGAVWMTTAEVGGDQEAAAASFDAALGHLMAAVAAIPALPESGIVSHAILLALGAAAEAVNVAATFAHLHGELKDHACDVHARGDLSWLAAPFTTFMERLRDEVLDASLLPAAQQLVAQFSDRRGDAFEQLKSELAQSSWVGSVDGALGSDSSAWLARVFDDFAAGLQSTFEAASNARAVVDGAIEAASRGPVVVVVANGPAANGRSGNKKKGAR